MERFGNGEFIIFIIHQIYSPMKTNANPILDLTLDFSLEIIDYCEELENLRKYILSRQLLKAATSIGANVNEAQTPESKADFIHKMKIADKESREAEYWLILCQRSKHYPGCGPLLIKVKEIQKILSSIIGTSRRN
jgi:four helix bundle protein